MARVLYNGIVLAESDKTERVEGNHYFPPESVNMQYFKPTESHTTCPWKGEASYYSVEVNGEVIPDAAWYYPDPKAAAKNIKDHVAFYGRKVTIED